MEKPATTKPTWAPASSQAEWLRLALHAGQAGFWEADIDTGENYWGEGVGALLGVSAGSAAHEGRRWIEYVHSDDRDRVVAGLEAARMSREPWAIEFRVVRADGEVRWISSSAMTVQTAGPARLIGMVQDITERRRAEDAARHSEHLQRFTPNHEAFYRLIQNNPFGVYLVDADFRLREVSLGAQKVFADVRPLIGRDFAEIVRAIWAEPAASAMIRHVRRTLSTGVSYTAESTLGPRADMNEAEACDWRMERITLPDGRLGVVCYFYDLSERRSLEEALLEADRRKDLFLATLAHELRNPLAPLASAIEILKVRQDDAGVVAKVNGVMERQVRHMVRLIDDLLDVSRITRGKVELRKSKIELASTLHHAVESCRPLLGQRTIELAVPDEPVYVDGDRARLAQVFGNLLNNACKFTHERGRIHVRADRMDSEVLVSVMDDGVGIAPEALPKVFDMFTQFEPGPDRTHAGLGLGLCLVKQLVELHGGAVSAHSGGRDRGAEFLVRLPLTCAPVASALTQPRIIPTARRVLVVDDNRDAADSIAMILELDGCELAIAYDGREALEKARAFKPDIVLLDIGMPGMNGHDTCRTLRREPEGKAISIVALTGWGQEFDKVISEAAGFDAHLVKPTSRETLAALLASPPRRNAELDS